MRKLILITAMLFALPVFAIAQITATGASDDIENNIDIRVGATVDAALTVSKTSDVDFGNFSTDSGTQTLNLNDNAGTDVESAGDGATYGQLAVSGLSGQNIVVEWPTAAFNITKLQADGTPEGSPTGVQTMVYTPLFYNGTASSSITSGTGFVLTGGAVTIYVGGDLAVPSNVEAGIYAGEFLASIRYDVDI